MKCNFIAVSLLVILFSAGGDAQQNRDEQQLIQMVRESEAARLKKDAAFFRRMLSDDYTTVSSLGNTSLKTDFVNGLQSENFSAFAYDDLKVRLYGDTALVTGRITYSGRFEGQQFNNRQVLTTQVFIRRGGVWQCVASQSTLVAAQQQSSR